MTEDIIQEQEILLEDDDIPTDDTDFDETEEEEEITTVEWDKDEFEEETRTEES